MDKNLFFYTRKVQITPKTETEEATFKDLTDSFNINKVIRSLEIEGGRYVVILDDFHDDEVDDRTKPIIDKVKNQFKGFKSKKGVVQSEITLEPQDAARFKEKLAI